MRYQQDSMDTQDSTLLPLLKQLEAQLISHSAQPGGVDYHQLVLNLIRQNITLKAELEKRNHLKDSEVLDIAPPQIDPLTQLPNRDFLAQMVVQSINRAQRHKTQFALIFIDIDHFKTINDTHGHSTGDALLKALTERITHSLRQCDLLCRLAGDEFCLIAEDIEHPNAIFRILNSIRQSVTEPFVLKELTLTITLSMGVSLYPTDGENFDELLHFADLAMYEAKRAGRNCSQIFTPEIAQQLHKMSEQQQALTESLCMNQLQFHFHPELNLGSGDVCAVRQIGSLPKVELATEAALYETAKRSHQLSRLNIELIKCAFGQLKHWQSLATNVPRIVIPLYKDLLCSDYCTALITELLTTHDLQGAMLEFEIEENDLYAMNDIGYQTLSKLHDMGCKVSLINFGIGPSSFQLLSSGKIHKIKIDSSLVAELKKDNGCHLMMDAIIQLTGKLNIKTVALDVTSINQVRLLKNLNCDGIRGEFYCAPLTSEQFEKTLMNLDRQKQLSEPSSFINQSIA
ncbi:bifunctional diguanylate cyclase/phosphodiesterase [Pleionea sp. CnH1-48]|uniref:putative bifunctional diguanylate cyclase/phosphodiesterase n=1 Tax=Pleionea sp. CnH1-48 TaxID=2954494 RepID=UPI002097061A|nr:diguanylate cyclase [Pleionea sp. CnH1-48]MCO7223913.1 diguanylate cyclase [Pleionea sp. CnH1-48]